MVNTVLVFEYSDGAYYLLIICLLYLGYNH